MGNLFSGLAEADGSTVTKLWIGATDEDTSDSSWVFMNGWPISNSFDPWHPDKPEGGKHYSILLKEGGVWKWDDVNSTGEGGLVHHMLCKIGMQKPLPMPKWIRNLYDERRVKSDFYVRFFIR